MHPETVRYNEQQEPNHKLVCDVLAQEIDSSLPEAENKIWHAHPVWFLAGNPIVGYSKQKAGIRLMFWSGADFEEAELSVFGKKFKDASIFYNDLSEVNRSDLQRWLKKAQEIQLDLNVFQDSTVFPAHRRSRRAAASASARRVNTATNAPIPNKI